MKILDRLIGKFNKFPSVGKRTATRFALYILHQPTSNVKELLEDIAAVKNKIKFCKICFNPFVPEKEGETLCAICKNPSRDAKIICVVESEVDLWSIEEKGGFGGVYFILGGLVDYLTSTISGKARNSELLKRIDEAKPKELILALSPTSEGLATIAYIKNECKDLCSNISQLAMGIPLGGEIEYMDEETLKSAFHNRKKE